MTEENPAAASGNPLGKENILKLLLRFAVPSIIAMVVNSVYNIVDQIFIGNSVGPDGNGATNISFPFITLSLAISLLVGAGCAANYNLRLGRGDTEGAAKCVGNAMTVMAVVSVLYLVFGLVFLKPLLRMFGGSVSDQIMDYAVEYSRIIVIGMPFAMTGTALSHIIRADGNPRFSMAFMLIGAVINVILDPIFIFACGWGMTGAAWATIIGQIVSFVVAACYLGKFKNVRLHLKHLLPRLGIIGSVLMLGISYFLTQMSFFVVQIVVNNVVTAYGAASEYGPNIPVTVLGIVMKVSQILFSVLIGISQGSQPIIGFNYGAKQFHRVRKTFLYAALAATGFAFLGWGAFELFPRQIFSMFGNGDEMYFAFAEKCFRIYLAATFAVGFQIVASNYFQAVGKPIKAAVLNLSRTIGFLVPLVLLLPLAFGLDGVLYAGPIADSLSAVLAAVFVTLEMRNLHRLAADASPHGLSV